MAPQKRLLIDNPPSASSTSDSSSDDANQYIQLPSKHPVVEVDSSSSEEDVQHSQPASQNPPPSTPISNPKPVATSESGSQSESEPLGSTPRSGTKRSLDTNNANGSSKKEKTVSALGGSDENDEMEEDVRLIGDDSKKSSHRLFSEEDELAILKGLAIFTSETGKDPLNDSTDFHSFVKKSLCAEATSQQLKRKIRSLKKKFETNESFTKSHDKKAFELFKKISWVFNGGSEANGKVLSGKSPRKDATVKHLIKDQVNLAVQALESSNN
ncbi:hypothetical protein TSUD_146610 [Trifolium subterraneum]|uniref:Glabrous enhancer-binding protein-like DBD domain-containing protein n=1 Tax=Trifolium subterraneum TaxID=3900 RepID=A0A2Z6M6Z5_TRISU|nr:hypothetical protein TSUD_146610 [Trifolium subterraneum]